MPSSPSGPLDRWLAPAPDPARIAFLKAQPFAHRGLHGGGRVENSRAACDAAIAIGHGIELDVRASHDGEAFVFHDEELDRLTAETGRFAARSARALDRVRLAGSDETIPSLHAILARVLGKVPVLIELKAEPGPVAILCTAVRRALEGYRGLVAVMSYEPEVGRWFAQHGPRYPRGLILSEEGKSGIGDRIRRRRALWRAKPDFLACDVRDLPGRFAQRQRARGLAVLAWTVRDAKDERTAFACADEMIYERTTG